MADGRPPGAGTPEKPPQRPREVVEAERQSVFDAFDKLQPKSDATSARFFKLTQTSQEQLQPILEMATQRQITDEEIKKIVPASELNLVLEIRDVQKQNSHLNTRLQQVEAELLPYRKEDLERLVKELSAKADYDAMFQSCHPFTVKEATKRDYLPQESGKPIS